MANFDHQQTKLKIIWLNFINDPKLIQIMAVLNKIDDI